MSNRPNTCEACGSIRIDIIQKQRILPVPLANSVYQNILVACCADCHAEIIVESDSAKQIKDLKFEQGKKSIAKLISQINDSGYSDSRIERVFGLSPHTLNRWKAGMQVSAAALALTRCVAIFPELVQVAETGFDSQKARILSFHESINALTRQHQGVSGFLGALNHSGSSYGLLGIMGEFQQANCNTENQAYYSVQTEPKILEATI